MTDPTLRGCRRHGRPQPHASAHLRCDAGPKAGTGSRRITAPGITRPGTRTTENPHRCGHRRIAYEQGIGTPEIRAKGRKLS